METSTQDEEKRLNSIRYILRRRKRAAKVRRGVGDEVRSWAEFSSVSTTPSSDRSSWQKAGWLLLLLVGFGFPVWLWSFVDDVQRSNLAWVETPWFAYVLYALLSLVAAAGIVICAVAILGGLFRVVFRNFRKKPKG